MSRKIPEDFSSIENLINALSISDAEIAQIGWYRSKMYERATIPKKSGGKRIIYCPNSRLKYLQTLIKEKLDLLYIPRRPVHGFASGRSVKSNAEVHLGRGFLLNIDLKDFFPSISERRVRDVLGYMGIPKDVSSILASLCCLRGSLPQGAPTSPVISNIICFPLDKDLMEFSRHRRLRYSRYADDITFSSKESLDPFLASPRGAGRLTVEEINQELVSIISRNGFELNAKKLRGYSSRSRKIVTGIVVGEKLGVPKHKVREARNIIYDIEKNGYAQAQCRFHQKRGSKTSLHNHLRGVLEWLAFVKGRDDLVFSRLASRFNVAMVGATPIKVMPSVGDKISSSIRVIEQIAQDRKGNQKAERQGTAFRLEGVGWITANHCVDLHDNVEIFLPGKLRLKATVSARCEHRDLALLSVHEDPEPPAFLASKSDPQRGEKLRVYGYPSFGPGDSIHERVGEVSSVHVKSTISRFDSTARFSGGMSGGPILNSRSEVIGVVYKGGVGEERDMATSISALRAWLKQQGIEV